MKSRKTMPIWIATLHLLTVATPTIANSNPIALRSQGTSQNDFRNSVNSFELVPLANKPILPPDHLKESLNDLILKTQNFFLNGKLKLAIEGFKKIAQLRFEAHWLGEERIAIKYSLLRLAQLEKNNREEWISRAISYSISKNGLNDIFPPPFLKEIDRIKDQLKPNHIIWNGENLPSGIESVHINGEMHELPVINYALLPNESYRVTVYSNIYEPISMVLSGDELMTKNNWPLAPIIEGSCASPTASKWALRELKHFVAIYKGGCSRKFHSGAWQSEAKSKLSTTEPPKAITFSPILNEKNGKAELKSIEPIQQIKAKPKSGKTWLWIGLGVLTAGSIYLISKSNENKNTRKKDKPTHGETGFTF